MNPLSPTELRTALTQYDTKDRPHSTVTGYTALSANCVHSARQVVSLEDALNREQATRPLLPGEECLHKKGGRYTVVTRTLSQGE